MDDNGDNVIDLKRPRPSIRDMFVPVTGKRPTPPAPDVQPKDGQAANLPADEKPVGSALSDELEPLPAAGSPYVAHARAANKPVLTVSFLLKDGVTIKGYSYSALDSIDRVPGEQPGDAPALVIRFAGLFPTEITIHGRNLGKLHSHLNRHVVPWVRELTGEDFLEEKAAVVTGITINRFEA